VRELNRTMLPIPDIQPPGLTTYDARDPDTHYRKVEPLRPPKATPNVLIVLIDEIDVDKDAENVDHFIKPEDRLAVAMALQ
jgi:hypothetical protein